jgi:FkbH-like protein
MEVREIIEAAQTAKTWSAYRRAAQKLRSMPGPNSEELPQRVRAAFLGSFTLEPVADFAVVEAAAAGIRLETYVGGYGQFGQEILGLTGGLDEFAPDVTFLMVELDSLVGRVSGRLPRDSGRQAAEGILSLADTFAKRYKGVLVLNTLVEDTQWPLHITVDDATRAIREANHLLLQACVDNPRVQLCDLDALAAYFGRREAVSPELRHMARIPFSEGFLALLARKIVFHVRACRGMTRKCLVLDCDDTLWGGIIGEDGIAGISLGPDSPGREYLDFQRAVVELQQMGVILAINSKNNLDDVLQVLRSHPHMLLRTEHFASIQANWNDKATNMQQIAEDLNISLDTFVFVDDNPTERAMMRAMLPEVYTLELPTSPSLFGRTLREMGEFAKASVTAEDRMRGQLYVAQRQREELRRTAVSVEEFLRSLEMVVSIRAAGSADIKRVAQLTQRTNQFNLTNRRYDESEVAELLNRGDARVYTVNVRDRFGDNGLVSVAILTTRDESWHVDTFVMSCRVIGRQVEDVLVDRVLRDAVASGVDTVRGKYVRSSKNGLVADLWRRMQFEPIEVRDDYSEWQVDVTNRTFRDFEYVCLETEKVDTEA